MDCGVMCRLCAGKTIPSKAIFFFGKDAHSIEWREKINKFTPIKLQENLDKKSPQHICLSCSEKLEACSLFWQQCELADKLILEKLDKKQVPKALEYFDKTVPKIKRGSYYCVARWCNNNNTTCSSMFRIPKGSRGKNWLKQADRLDLLEIGDCKINRKYLCNKHFTKECFLKNNLLTWNAVPTIFDDYKLLTHQPKEKLEPKQKQVKKLRTLLPAPAECTKGDETKPVTANTSCSTQTIASFNLKSLAKTNFTEEDSSANPFVGEINQDSSSSQPNKNILVVIPKGAVKLVKTLNSDVLSSGKRCKSFESNEQAGDRDKSIVALNSKKVKVDSAADGVEMTSDIEGIVSGQTYKDSMLPCSGCGEVFLMSSNLNQHLQRYHGEHFDNSLGT